MKIAFLGSPPPAVPILERIVADGHTIETVVTPPDRKRGRGGALIPTAVGAAAKEHGLHVVHRLAECDFSRADVAVVVAYGRIIPTALLEQIPMLNVHFSLLPRWRGAAPVERAILAGDDETGVCVMGIEPELDTGPVYLRSTTPIGHKSSSELLTELSRMGAEAMSVVLSRFSDMSPEPQVGEATYAEKLTAQDFVIEPSMSATQAARVIRLGRTRIHVGPVAIKIHRATVRDGAFQPGSVRSSSELILGCGDGALVLETVQPDGGRVMGADEWWRGQRFDEPVSWSPVSWSPVARP